MHIRQRLTSVSYTHLDVYKRQIHNSGLFKGSDKNEDYSTNALADQFNFRTNLDLLAFDHLGQNRLKAGEDGGAEGVEEPGAGFGLARGPPDRDHEPGARGDDHDAQRLEPVERLMKEDHRQEHGQNGAGLVDGRDLADVAQLERPEVTQPRRAGGQARKTEKRQRAGADLTKGVLGPHHKYHEPGKGQHHNGAQGRCHIGVRVPDADLGQNGGGAREQGGAEGKNNPHLNPHFPPRCGDSFLILIV